MDKRDRFDSLIRYYSTISAIPFSLVKAQMLAESDANPAAVSTVGAKGLAQFMPATWVEIADPGDDPFNPEHSIRAQCRYMAQLLKRFHGDTAAALAAYNWGPGRVRDHLVEHGHKLNEAALPAETRSYVEKIARKRGAIEGVKAHA